ncbi:MAG: hypothetical protein HY752_04310 [Nitrospirae bacterium]|nr:hypothetical protein [Nitrospirota bacterium]
MKRLLFNFRGAYIYTFVAGILISQAAALFNTALLSKSLNITTRYVYGISASLFISSIGAFIVGILLETARSKWQVGGSQEDLKIGYIDKYIRWIYFSFIIFIIGFIVSVILYVSSSV